MHKTYLIRVPTHGCVCTHANGKRRKIEGVGTRSIVFPLFEGIQKQVLSSFVAFASKHWLLHNSNPKALMPLRCYIQKTSFKQQRCRGGKPNLLSYSPETISSL